METKRLGLESLELKFVGDEMKFSGYASVFGMVDSYGDTIDPEAYEKTLAERDRPIRMRWNHYGEVIGKYTNIFTDRKGLYVEGELTPGHSKAMDVYASLKHGAIDGLSIGYIPVQFKYIDEGRRLLQEIKLIEISVVEEPADIHATISNVKSAIEVCKDLKSVEALLRDAAGFSRGDAKALISRIKSLAIRDESADNEHHDLVEFLQKQLLIETLKGNHNVR